MKRLSDQMFFALETDNTHLKAPIQKVLIQLFNIYAVENCVIKMT